MDNYFPLGRCKINVLSSLYTEEENKGAYKWNMALALVDRINHAKLNVNME